MRKFLVIIFLLIASAVNSQSKYFSEVDTIRLKSDTILTSNFSSSPNAVYTSFVLVCDTAVTNTLQFYQITENNDTIPLGFRLLEDYNGTTDFNCEVTQSQRADFPKSAKEYLILNPTVNRVFVRAKSPYTNRIHYRIYLRKNKLAG